MKKPSPATLAARLLRAIPSEKRSKQSAINGRNGGRPPLPSCPVRELRSRVRHYCVAHGMLSRVSELQAVALEMRETWNSPPCSRFSVGDLAHCYEFPLDRLSLHRKAIAHLVPREPVLL